MKTTGQRLLTQRAIENGIASERPEAGEPKSVAANLAQSPFGWLFARELVSRPQFDAGERLNCRAIHPCRCCRA